MPHARRALAVITAVLLLSACGDSGGVFSPSARLSPALRATVDSLVLDEYRAAARYQQVLQHFGTVEPFAGLEAAQGRRVSALLEVYHRYPAFPPDDPYRASVQAYTTFTSVTAACEDAVALEEATADRYRRAIGLGAPEDVLKVLRYNRANTLAYDVVVARRCADAS